MVCEVLGKRRDSGIDCEASSKQIELALIWAVRNETIDDTPRCGHPPETTAIDEVRGMEGACDWHEQIED